MKKNKNILIWFGVLFLLLQIGYRNDWFVPEKSSNEIGTNKEKLEKLLKVK